MPGAGAAHAAFMRPAAPFAVHVRPGRPADRGTCASQPPSARRAPPGEPHAMIDLAYVLGTAAFFALMLAYVRGCERLGRAAAADGARAGAPAEESAA